LHSLRAGLQLRNDRESDRDQDGDDAEYNQQLQQRKGER
jgi:hypothetical protein